MLFLINLSSSIKLSCPLKIVSQSFLHDYYCLVDDTGRVSWCGFGVRYLAEEGGGSAQCESRGQCHCPWCDTHGWGHPGPRPCHAAAQGESGATASFQALLGLDEQKNAAAKIMRERGRKTQISV